MRNRLLSMAFEKWQYEAEEAKRLQYVLGGALRRMQNYKMSQAWEQWQYWYAELKAQQFRLAGAIRRMLNRKLSKGWEQWQWYYAQVKAAMEALANMRLPEDPVVLEACSRSCAEHCFARFEATQARRSRKGFPVLKVVSVHVTAGGMHAFTIAPEHKWAGGEDFEFLASGMSPGGSPRRGMQWCTSCTDVNCEKHWEQQLGLILR